MVTLYTTPSCASCRKAKAWLKENQIEFVEREILSKPLTVEEVKEILRMTNDGTDEIISFRSEAFKNLNIDLESLQLQQLYKIIRENPSMLRSPIIKDEKRMNVGFNQEEIRSFLPRKARIFIYDEDQQMSS